MIPLFGLQIACVPNPTSFVQMRQALSYFVVSSNSFSHNATTDPQKTVAARTE
jgi:hypothetical protein